MCSSTPLDDVLMISSCNNNPGNSHYVAAQPHIKPSTCGATTTAEPLIIKREEEESGNLLKFKCFSPFL